MAGAVLSALALAAVLVVVLYVAACSILYRRLFVPDRAAPVESMTPWEMGADHEDVELVAADGTGFRAWFFPQPGSEQVVVVSGGHKGRREDLLGVSAALWRKGFNVLAYGFRGYPGCDPAPVTMGVHEVQELQAAVAFARRHVRDARIGLLGYSMGAAVSILGAAGEPAVQALVLDSPFSDARELLRENVRRRAWLPGRPLVWGAAWWLRRRCGARLADASPMAVLASLEPRPLFFIHGGADAVTDVRHSRALHDAYRGPREIWVVQGAGHAQAYFADRRIYVERVAGFFARHLGLQSTNRLRLLEDEAGEAG